MLRHILKVMRANPPDSRELTAAADTLEQLLRPSNPQHDREQRRRLDAERIKERVAEVTKELVEIYQAIKKMEIDDAARGRPWPQRRPHTPTLTERAWQIVAGELGLTPRSVRRARDRAVPQDKDAAERRAYAKLDRKGAVTPEGKALRRSVERNR
jgi:hypothetical protein